VSDVIRCAFDVAVPVDEVAAAEDAVDLGRRERGDGDPKPLVLRVHIPDEPKPHCASRSCPITGALGKVV
jgi:hypothetical protein